MSGHSKNIKQSAIINHSYYSLYKKDEILFNLERIYLVCTLCDKMQGSIIFDDTLWSSEKIRKNPYKSAYESLQHLLEHKNAHKEELIYNFSEILKSAKKQDILNCYWIVEYFASDSQKIKEVTLVEIYTVWLRKYYNVLGDVRIEDIEHNGWWK